jgi:hypothetical protein
MLQQVPTTSPTAMELILWEDIFVVIDDGSGRPSDYDTACKMIVEQSSEHQSGLGCLVIIPPNAKPPSDDVRKAINRTLDSVPVRGICWCVEGSGFQAAMVRAVLSGLRFVSRRNYPTHIEGDLGHATKWIVSSQSGAHRTARPDAAQSLLNSIEKQRRRRPPRRSVRPTAG